MHLVQGIASGAISVDGDMPKSIQGDTSEVLAKACIAEYGRDGPVRLSSRATTIAQINVSATVPAPVVNGATQQKAKGAMEQVRKAMDKGMAKIQSLKAVVGQSNGATDLITTSMQNLVNDAIAKMMTKVMKYIIKAHSITHPLFVDILLMTWSENKQWVPKWLLAELGLNPDEEGGYDLPNWKEELKAIPEYFDFIQKIMGGAIGEVMEEMDFAKETMNHLKQNGGLSGMSVQAQAGVSVTMPALNVPLMSISKQVEDVQRKISYIKEMIRNKAKLLLNRLKSLNGPDLRICPPKSFLLLLEVLIEAQFIYANLHIVMDKILEYFINMFV